MSPSSIDEKIPYAGTSPVPESTYDDSELATSEVDQRKVLRKLDLRLLPFVSLLYLLSFLYVIGGLPMMLHGSHADMALLRLRVGTERILVRYSWRSLDLKGC